MPRMEPFKEDKPVTSWRARLHEFNFDCVTCSSKLESVASIRVEHGRLLRTIEWVFTILFTIEYILRLICVRHPLRYATSFFGIIDLLAVIPTYLDLILPGTRFLFVIRILRLLRVFRVLKLVP